MCALHRRLIFFSLLLHCAPPTQSKYSFGLICEGGKNKCDGRFECDTGDLKTDSQPLKVKNVPDINECKRLCIDSSECRVLTHQRQRPFTCRLYTHGSYDKRISPTDVCIWTCCNGTKYCSREGPRCPGHWTREYGVQIINSRVLGNDSAPEPSYIDCLKLCDLNPLCAAVNFRTLPPSSQGMCQLVMFPLHGYSTTNATDNDVILMWRCCPHNDSDVTPVCHQAANKCRGRWIPSNQLPANGTRLVIPFYTQDKFQCLEECERNPYCHRAFYSDSSKLCLTKSNESMADQTISCDGNQYNTEGHYYAYLWECCNKDKHEKAEDNEKAHAPDAMVSGNGKCRCFNVNNKTTRMFPDNCGRPFFQEGILLTSPFTAFWEVDIDPKEYTAGYSKYGKFHNGLMEVWVKMIANNSQSCSITNCQLFSTPINGSCPQIVSRAEWFAGRRSHALSPFPKTPTTLMVMDVGCPVFGCYTISSCADTMRSYQYFHMFDRGFWDIAYNFVVGSDGRVYVGRGSQYMGLDPVGFEDSTISIAFIGKYSVRFPSPASLAAAKRLILCLVREGDVTSGAQLLTWSEMGGPAGFPGKMLFGLMHNWPHFASHAFRDRPCPSIRPLWVSALMYGAVPVTLLIVVVAVATVGYLRVWRHAVWCPRRLQESRGHRTVKLCEPGRHRVLARHLQALPSQCIIRDSSTWCLEPDASRRPPIFVDVDPVGCACARQLELLWFHCVLHSWQDFPHRVTRSLALQRCPRPTVVMATGRLFVVHGQDEARMLKLIEDIGGDRCVCGGAGTVVAEVAHMPSLDAVALSVAPAGWSSQWLAWTGAEEGGRREAIGRYQHLFVGRHDRVVEVTYEQFRSHGREAGLAARVEMGSVLEGRARESDIEEEDEEAPATWATAVEAEGQLASCWDAIDVPADAQLLEG